ncbi:hypothetical protein KFL_001700160 [Klebsormidium nitens]|uniref:Stc1 domain-containing protein n=1 Tax=Klebsormidium nitens TaxID=105231 RepID=A0A1Y1I459_KLENI|nr:hypothetical protein KFL_001700160 [Klebsormidium nitens]|eukprot:GAQ83961.1 hypothetical protein KFL_001700160 [Klebsormidium nitens]
MVQREHDDNDTITVSSTEHEKRCGMCLKVRRLREFQPQRSSPDGVHYWCRGCAAQLSRARRGLAAGVVAGQAHCPCCGEVKDRALFGLESRQRSGLQKICRACVAEDYQTRPNVTGRSERKWPVWAQERRPMVITLRRKEGLWVPTEKVCLTCGELKSAGEYFSDPTKMDGLRQYCKPCWCRKHSVHPSRRVKRPKHPEAPVIPSVMMDEVRAAFRWLVGDEQKMPDAARRETERQKSLQSTSRGAE